MNVVIQRLSLGDYSPIFTSPEATNCEIVHKKNSLAERMVFHFSPADLNLITQELFIKKSDSESNRLSL